MNSEHLMFSSYDFSSREDVKTFDAHLNGFCFMHGIGLTPIALSDGFDRHFPANRRSFYMLVDLKLCLINTFLSVRDLERTRRRNDIMELMLFQKAWFSFVTSYRSFYDKFMNLIVDNCYPQQVKWFESSKSRKKAFVAIVHAQPTSYLEDCQMFVAFPPEFVDWMASFIRKIDDEYRTAEVHGSGRARKWIFSEPDLSKTPYRDIGNFIDHMSTFLNMIACICSGRQTEMMTKRQ
jgi:hypothetical protein